MPRNDRRVQLRVEALESRRMLSGVVQVQTYPAVGLNPGDLALVGDTSQHSVQITSTPSGLLDQFTITSKDGTLFQLNGASPTLTSVPVDGITGNIAVNLGLGGTNTFDFEAPTTSPGSVSTVLGNLTITNSSVEKNVINNVLIQGSLTVIDASYGYHEFDALGTQVNGPTLVNNYGTVSPPATFSGDSYTNITNCTFEGLAVKGVKGTPAPLTIDNGVGNNQVWIQGETPPAAQTTPLTTTQIGFETFTPAVNALVITNGDSLTPLTQYGGGSNITFTDAGAASDPVIYGAIQITNGRTFPLQSNQVNFVTTVVYGAVNITNQAGGDTSTSVQSSKLGEQLQANAPVQVINQGTGANQFLMTGSELPGVWPSVTLLHRMGTQRSSIPVLSVRPAWGQNPRSRPYFRFPVPARRAVTCCTSAGATTASAARTRSLSATAP